MFEESSPKAGIFAFCHKKASLMKQTDLRDMFNRAFKSVLPQMLRYIPTLLISSAMKTPEYTEEGPGDPGSADEGGTQMEYSSY